MYPLGTNDSDGLTYFLRFPAALARWGISCLHLHLEYILVEEAEPGQEREEMGFCIAFLSCNVCRNLEINRA